MHDSNTVAQKAQAWQNYAFQNKVAIQNTMSHVQSFTCILHIFAKKNLFKQYFLLLLGTGVVRVGSSCQGPNFIAWQKYT